MTGSTSRARTHRAATAVGRLHPRALVAAGALVAVTFAGVLAPMAFADDTSDADPTAEASSHPDRVDALAADEPVVAALGEAEPVVADVRILRRGLPPIPEPAPAPALAPPAPAGSVVDLIHQAFGPNGGAAVAVARCESSLNPNAVSSGGGNHGLFQINNVHSGRFASVTGRSWADRYDPSANIAYAKWLFDQSGWGPWACKRVL